MIANLSKIQIAVLIFIVISACGCKDKVSGPIGERPVVNFEIDRQAVWHEGYNLIAYAHGCPGLTDPDSAGIYIINPDGSGKRLFYRGSFFISGLDWSPDGRWIIVDDYRRLVKISFPDGVADTLISGDRNFFPVWSPDGQNITYTKHVGDDSGVYICDSNGNNSRLIIRYGHAVDWPFQDSLLFVNFDTIYNIGSIYMADISGTYGAEIIPHYNNFIQGTFRPRMHSITRRIAFQAQEPGHLPSLWFYNPYTNDIYKIRELATGPNFSPDGSEVIFTDYREGNGRLWIINWDGTGLRQLTF